MPRPRNPDGREPKSRSRNGCWSCKARKVKCTEERPRCAKCVKGGYQCDYGIRLNWDGRRSKRPQLKAMHLGEEVLMDANDYDDGGADADDIDDDAAAAQLLQPTHQHSPPSTSSSASSAVPTMQRLSFMPVQGPGQGAPRAASRTQAARTSAATKAAASSLALDTDSPFRILTPSMAAIPAANFRFEVHTSASQPRRAPSISANTHSSSVSSVSSGTARTQLPAVGATFVSDTASAASDSQSQTHARSERRSLKRQRLDSDVSERDFAWQWPMSPSTGSASIVSATSPHQLFLQPNSLVRSVEESLSQTSPHGVASLQLQAAADFRRLSVSSLLSGPVDLSSAAGTPLTSCPTPPATTVPADVAEAMRVKHDHSHDHRHGHLFGVDYGFRDLDLGKNDDANALAFTPVITDNAPPPTDRGQPPLENDVVHERAGYYTKPVHVRIPNALGELPAKLTENPMNILYFHHFINHTARVLVPHDDPQSNPFRTILPQMALQNDNLLSLLLAYSASHRARVLCQEEPAMRIALWVQDIFPALRNALDDHKQKISNANVATAIMLASLAIVAPTAFGYTIPWQKHLMLAREIIAARPEGLRMAHHSTQEGQVCSFLWSWFAYIDVLGGLSGGPTDASPAWILDFKVYDPQDDDEIDCIMGFTTRCVYILSQIAELVRQCEPERLRVVRKDPDGWIPSMEVGLRAESLEVDVRDSMVQKPRACAHLHRTGDVMRWDREEMEATNEAYHWAALVQLQRRVLGKPTDHVDVQGPILQILACIDRVRFGGTAENCLLFPLFTAGCDCLDAAVRKKIVKRMISIEGTAMMQVTDARALMQRAWSTGKPWESLLTHEFIG